MNKKLFLAGLFCLVSFALQAQKDDLGLWTSVGMEKRLFRDFDLSLEGEFRSRDKLSEVGRWSGSAGMGYKKKKRGQKSRWQAWKRSGE